MYPFKFLIPVFLTGLIVFQSCKKEAVAPPTPLADKFVGKYLGIITEVDVDGGIYTRDFWVTIVKTSDSDLMITYNTVELSYYKWFIFNATVKNDSLMEIPIQNLDFQKMKYVGSGSLKNSGELRTSFDLNQSNAFEASTITFIGSKQ